MQTSTPRRLFERTLFPLFIMMVCPPAAVLLWSVNVKFGGSLGALWRRVADDGLFATVFAIWRPVFFGTPEAWAAFAAFAAVQIVLLQTVPGKPFEGPATPAGDVPTCCDNGFACFVITVVAYAVGAYGLKLFSPTFVYDNFGGIIGALNDFAVLLCAGLWVRGLRDPPRGNSGSGGNFVFDFYWGMERHPHILGIDVKRLVTCRLGMMGWALIVMSFAAKQRALHGIADSMLVAAGLQLLYIGKFFWWERGYLSSTDIVLDRSGFYILWGTLVWVPAFYALPVLYLVDHPNRLGPVVALALFSVGAVMITVNYVADAQRQRVRETNGRCRVWGRPPDLIEARDRTAGGAAKKKLLLVSGWWGLARHCHYPPEVLAALCWSVPAGFDHVLPYLYVAFLVILLAHRVTRLERRGREKYGEDWERYRQRVPYAVLPGLW